MKVAMSLPDDLFHAAERLARISKRHRSDIYADALREYVARHSPDEVTASLNAVVEQIDDASMEDRFVAAAARQALTSADR